MEPLGIMPLGLGTLYVQGEKRIVLSRDAGKRIVEMVGEDLRPSDILAVTAFKNAVATCMAPGGNTNAIIYLTALAVR